MSDFFQHENALVESTTIGANTRIWAFAHVLPDAQIGEDCNICDHVFIENDVSIGDRVTVKCGVQIWDGIDIGNDVFVGPNVTFTNDPWPRSKQWPEKFDRTVIEEGASLGAGAVILPGLKIGRGAMIGAGSVVTRSVPPHAVVVGNPGRIVRYTVDSGLEEIRPEAKETSTIAELVEGVFLDVLPIIRDLRGDLMAREVGKGLPFVPRRVFAIFDVPSKEVRGEHAHKECHQLLICLSGSVQCLVDNGNARTEYELDSPEKALHIPPMVWGTQYKYSKDAVLLVLASHEYDPDDYIRNYQDFLNAKAAE